MIANPGADAAPITIPYTQAQLEAREAAYAHRYTLFGGARGPGKSWFLRWLEIGCSYPFVTTTHH